MTLLADVLARISAALSELEVRFSLIGGLAVSVRTEPRFTRDVDVAVAVKGDAEAEALVRELLRRGYQVLAHLEQTAAGRMASVRLAGTGAVVDLLFASSGVETELVAAAEPLAVLPGVTVPVATVPHLLALKVLRATTGSGPRTARTRSRSSVPRTRPAWPRPAPLSS